LVGDFFSGTYNSDLRDKLGLWVVRLSTFSYVQNLIAFSLTVLNLKMARTIITSWFDVYDTQCAS